MSSEELGAIDVLSDINEIKKFWKDEEALSDWLADNIELLSSALDIKLVVKEREAPIGSLRADIVAAAKSNDEPERKAVIEVQMGQSDHDHLGKLFTYAACERADIIIWITLQAPKLEHRAAVEWFNSMRAGVSFYLCELKLLRIGSSPHAPWIEVLERPNRVDSSKRKQNKEYWSSFFSGVEKHEDCAKFKSSFKMDKNCQTWFLRLDLEGAPDLAKHYSISLMRKQNDRISVGCYVEKNDEEGRKALEEKLDEIAGDVFDGDVAQARGAAMPFKVHNKAPLKGEMDLDRDAAVGWYIDTALKMRDRLERYLG